MEILYFGEMTHEDIAIYDLMFIVAVKYHVSTGRVEFWLENPSYISISSLLGLENKPWGLR